MLTIVAVVVVALVVVYFVKKKWFTKEVAKVEAAVTDSNGKLKV
jgi:hypothetical protein